MIAQNNQMGLPYKMDYIASQMINNNASKIKASFAITHRQLMHGVIFKTILKLVFLKMELIATIHTKDIVLLM